MTWEPLGEYPGQQAWLLRVAGKPVARLGYGLTGLWVELSRTGAMFSLNKPPSIVTLDEAQVWAMKEVVQYLKSLHDYTAEVLTGLAGAQEAAE